MPSKRGARVIVPYLRGLGPTRFLFENTPRSGQQAALAQIWFGYFLKRFNQAIS
jgi:hypothetical protein